MKLFSFFSSVLLKMLSISTCKKPYLLVNIMNLYSEFFHKLHRLVLKIFIHKLLFLTLEVCIYNYSLFCILVLIQFLILDVSKLFIVISDMLLSFLFFILLWIASSDKLCDILLILHIYIFDSLSYTLDFCSLYLYSTIITILVSLFLIVFNY